MKTVFRQLEDNLSAGKSYCTKRVGTRVPTG